MLLAIDAGNSTVAFGFFEGGKLLHVFRTPTDKEGAPEEYGDFIVSRMSYAGIAPGTVRGAVISSVVPQLVPVLSGALKGICEAAPLVVSAGLKLGIRVGYNTPGTLGPDRLSAAAGAYAAYGGPVIVIDFGTATTLSVVDGAGVFIGGMIAPGLMTSYDALVERTSSLPREELKSPERAIGTTTSEGIRSGVIIGHAAMAEGLLSRARAELGGNATAVATGGLANLVVPHMLGLVKKDDDLVLKGLSVIYGLNS
jgi:type III pantothenate kinase